MRERQAERGEGGGGEETNREGGRKEGKWEEKDINQGIERRIEIEIESYQVSTKD